jgi:hypothetical protein
MEITPLCRVNDNQSFKIKLDTTMTLNGAVPYLTSRKEKIIKQQAYMAIEEVLNDFRSKLI